MVDETRIVFTVAFALVFYVLAAAHVDRFAIGRVTTRRLGSRPRIAGALPVLGSSLATAALLLCRPSPIAAWAIWLSLGLNLSAVVMAVVFQTRMTIAAHAANGLLFAWMLARILLPGPAPF
jgi:hypothetical protein